jgi:hypothetical protein
MRPDLVTASSGPMAGVDVHDIEPAPMPSRGRISVDAPLTFSTGYSTVNCPALLKMIADQRIFLRQDQCEFLRPARACA